MFQNYHISKKKTKCSFIENINFQQKFLSIFEKYLISKSNFIFMKELLNNFRINKKKDWIYCFFFSSKSGSKYRMALCNNKEKVSTSISCIDLVDNPIAYLIDIDNKCFVIWITGYGKYNRAI